MLKKTISIVLVVVTLFSIFAVTVSAASTKAFDILTSSKYAKTYTLSSSGRTIPYTSKSLTTRGTVTYGASSSSYIDNSSDEIYILDVGCTNGKYWAYVSYPVGSGKRVKAYIYLSAITKNNGNHNKSISKGKFYCSTRENSSLSGSYYVASGDTVYLVATSSSKYQILYPISNGSKWRLAWCNKADYQKYCEGKKSSTKLYNPVPSGCYFNKKTNDNGWYGYHDININVSKSTPVYAITSGTVTYKQAYAVIGGKKYLVSYGNHVEFKSDDGVYRVIYAHLNSFKGANQQISSSMTKQMSFATARNNGYSTGILYCGQNIRVSAGQLLGFIGTTGNSSGNHLHIEVYKNGTRVDPTTVFSGLTR